MAFADEQGAALPVPQPIQHQVSDANNPAAQAFAVSRLNQLVRAHLLGAMPQHMTDPAQVWRGLSATLQQNPQALQAFLAANRPAAQQHRALDPRFGIPDQYPGQQALNTPPPAASIRPQTGTPYPESQPFHPAISAILSLLQPGVATPYGGRR